MFKTTLLVFSILFVFSDPAYSQNKSTYTTLADKAMAKPCKKTLN